jgi:predicted DNA-binding ribbon-helix-helix protein
VKLVDYQSQMAELDASTNPFAMVVKAHLKMQETKRDKPSRKVWKMRLVRQIHESGYNQEEVVNLFNFMDWVLGLPEPLEAEFWTELKAYEEERRMPYITSVERIGYKRGRDEGLRSLVSLQLGQKVGQLSQEAGDRIATLSLDQLEGLAIALLNFNSIDDLNLWLETNG